MDQAVDTWEAAYKIAAAEIPAGIPQLMEVLGVAYLHKSENEERCLSASGRLVSLPAAPRQALSGNGRFRESRSYFLNTWR